MSTGLQTDVSKVADLDRSCLQVRCTLACTCIFDIPADLLMLNICNFSTQH